MKEEKEKRCIEKKRVSFDLVFFAGDTVEPLILCAVNVSAVPDPLEKLRHEFLVAWVGGAYEAVVRDVQLRPQRCQDSCHEEIRSSHTCGAASTSDALQTFHFSLFTFRFSLFTSDLSFLTLLRE